MSEQGVHTATAELYRLYERINADRFEGKLPTPQITIQGMKLGILGWCSVGKIWRGESERYEINLCAEHLNRPVIEIAGTLIHEMAHLANLVQDIRDCTGHQYHNKAFKQMAEYLGLEVTQIKGYGYAHTSVGQALEDYLGKFPLQPEAFKHYRLPMNIDPKTGKKRPRGSQTKMKKWTCGCTNVRCAVALDAICEKCGNPFIRA